MGRLKVRRSAWRRKRIRPCPQNLRAQTCNRNSRIPQTLYHAGFAARHGDGPAHLHRRRRQCARCSRCGFQALVVSWKLSLAVLVCPFLWRFGGQGARAQPRPFPPHCRDRHEKGSRRASQRVKGQKNKNRAGAADPNDRPQTSCIVHP